MAILFEAHAIAQLEHIRDWLREHADQATADAVVDRILERCHSLADFPARGTPHDEVRPGLRTIPVRRRYTIGYRVTGPDVIILGVIGAGQLISEIS